MAMRRTWELSKSFSDPCLPGNTIRSLETATRKRSAASPLTASFAIPRMARLRHTKYCRYGRRATTRFWLTRLAPTYFRLQNYIHYTSFPQVSNEII